MDVARKGTAPAQLVSRIRDGDRAAESEMIARYSRSLMTMLRCRTGDVQRAEDVHQETFCIVLERLRSKGIDKPEKLAAFLHRTATNVLIGQYRTEARRQTFADTELIQASASEQSDQLVQLIKDEANGAVRATIQELRTPRDREILYRFYILQHEKQAVCRTLALTSEHFDRVIARARKRFRELIERKRLSLVSPEGEA